jgi:trehalose utilization protein
MASPIRVTVWNEFRHEQHKDHPASTLYPEGIHGAIAAGLGAHAEFVVRTATLDQPEHGLTDAVLESTDVLTWWGHMAHHEVSDAVVEKVQKRVLDGMGLIVLHSGHHSKPFKALVGTNANLAWRDDGERERLWVVDPAHPIAAGLGPYFEVEREEMYGEPFVIPTPDELIFLSWFQGGEVFRSGCTWRRGNGKIFYFRPGHETFPTYYNSDVQRVILNGVGWAAGTVRQELKVQRSPAIEKI